MIEKVILILDEIEKEDLPERIKKRIGEVKGLLIAEGEELSVKASKVASMLEELSEDPEISTYTRTLMWNAISLLESIE